MILHLGVWSREQPLLPHLSSISLWIPILLQDISLCCISGFHHACLCLSNGLLASTLYWGDQLLLDYPALHQYARKWTHCTWKDFLVYYSIWKGIIPFSCSHEMFPVPDVWWFSNSFTRWCTQAIGQTKTDNVPLIYLIRGIWQNISKTQLNRGVQIMANSYIKNYLGKNYENSQAWWWTPLIPALGR